MSSQKNQTFNKTLALSISIGGAIVFFCLLIALYLMPEDTAAAIDRVNIKLLLAVVGLAVISAAGAFLYLIFHDPTAKRLVVLGWQGIFVLSAMGSGYSFFGWPRLESIALNSNVGLEATFSAKEVANDVWPVLAVCFIAVFMMSVLYFVVKFTEHKVGQEI